MFPLNWSAEHSHSNYGHMVTVLVMPVSVMGWIAFSKYSPDIYQTQYDVSSERSYQLLSPVEFVTGLIVDGGHSRCQ